MTCESALELLLDAEPSEFSASEPTPLGGHLRGCTRCRRVAAQLLRDTKDLALAMDRVPVRRLGRARHFTLVPAFAMAALLVVVLLPGNPDAPVMAPPVLEPVTAVVPPPVRTAKARSAVGTPVVHRQTAYDVRRPRREFARAVPLAPARLVAPVARDRQLSVESSGVTVTPAPGTRATLMHTSNPKLVVVWLY